MIYHELSCDRCGTIYREDALDMKPAQLRREAKRDGWGRLRLKGARRDVCDRCMATWRKMKRPEGLPDLPGQQFFFPVD